ncbi:MAG: TauD/TfdA dioxygenase family protein [Parasphingopyxis sp.]|nr:TauD/TfdA family dioxygenase [Sphingomonadales bacterium]
MKTMPINNGVEVTDIDLMDDDECRELGRLVAHECVVLVRDKVPEKRLHDIHMLWGQPSRAIVYRYVGDRLLKGRHWRSVLASLTHLASAVEHVAGTTGMVRVSFERDEKGRPTGAFTNGKLDWHSDQQGYHDSQRIVGLMSLWGSKNSQTSFLCTAPVYDALDTEDRSMVDELVSVWTWDGGSMSEELIESQKEVVRYNQVPYPNMETRLLGHTVTGRPGIHFPSHSFSHFRGMSREDSLAFRDHLWQKINRPENIYTHDWSDGEMMFMDQNITLHARPTNVTEGDTRTMSRMISYLDKLFPGNGPADHVLYDGRKLDHETFAGMVDEQRRKEFYGEDTRELAGVS